LYTKNDTLIAAAWLHDVVEDTCITNEIIQEEFGDEIATLVHYLTDVSVESDGNRAKRKAIDLAHTMTASNDAKTIKLSDIISNVKSIKEHDAEFANVYLPEKRAQLQVLIGGNSDLYIIAQKLLEE
jgi:(p)ppGpp synthase/HD superfamily hydrolase